MPTLESPSHPIFLDSGQDLAIDIVRYVDETIERKPWTSKEIDKYFAQRSPLQILSDKHTFYMNPCLDLTLASAAIAQLNGVPQTIVIEEHAPTSDFPFCRLHFALEIHEPGMDCFINYRNGNNVEIGEGEYRGRSDLKRMTMLRKHWNEIDYSLPLHVNLGYSTLQGIGKEFKGFDLKKQLAKLKKDNTPENFQRYQEKFGRTFNISIIK